MEIDKIIKSAEESLKNEFSKVDEMAFINSKKVIDAFHKNKVSEIHFSSTSGYGYNDVGRDVVEKVFSDVLGAEDAIVRNQFVSGSHALTVALFSVLRPDDIMLAISGEPYDTLKEVIGIVPNESSLRSFGVGYEQIDLANNDFDYDKIEETLKRKFYKLVHIQRSRGYSTRESLTIDKVEKVIKLVKKVSPESIVMVDNCYCEFVETTSPCEIGADLVVGSLIKNLGGGVAPNGAYIAGVKKYVDLAGERLTLPGEGREVGPTLGINETFLRGIYMAPSVVASSLKIAMLASKILEDIGYSVSPKWNERRADIVEAITFGNREDLINFVQGIQMGSAIDAFAIPEPTDMPGYEDKIIMASGSFVQGSSIEISSDGPIREPYIAYLQGGITYDYGKIALSSALERMNKQ